MRRAKWSARSCATWKYAGTSATTMTCWSSRGFEDGREGDVTGGPQPLAGKNRHAVAGVALVGRRCHCVVPDHGPVGLQQGRPGLVACRWLSDRAQSGRPRWGLDRRLDALSVRAVGLVVDRAARHVRLVGLPQVQRAG